MASPVTRNKKMNELEKLQVAVRLLLEDVNKRYPEKNPRQWNCKYMQNLDDMVPHYEELSINHKNDYIVAYDNTRHILGSGLAGERCCELISGEDAMHNRVSELRDLGELVENIVVGKILRHELLRIEPEENT